MNLIEAIKTLTSHPNFLSTKNNFVYSISRKSWLNDKNNLATKTNIPEWAWMVDFVGSKKSSIHFLDVDWPTTEDFLSDDWYVVESERKIK